jgi:hypothetical protein
MPGNPPRRPGKSGGRARAKPGQRLGYAARVDDLDRFLDLVKRELGCDDARFEYGGREPSSDTGVWTDLAHGFRIVASFTTAPREREAKQAKLGALVESFSGVGEQLRTATPKLQLDVAIEEVDYALGVLADKTKALRALVLDEDSPVLWGSSELPRGSEDIEVAEWTGELIESALQAELDLVELVALDDTTLRERLEGLPSRKLRDRLLRRIPTLRELGGQRDAAGWRVHFLVCRAIAAIRRAPERHVEIREGLGWLTREFGGIYHVVLVYDGEFDELHATGMLLRALPAIEKLVLALPPIEPTPKGARVLMFPPR